MKIVGAFEAKTHLASLLQRVEKGEPITITRRGVPVARLVPADGARGAPVMKTLADFWPLGKAAR